MKDKNIIHLDDSVLDGINYEICRTQGNIYEYIAEQGLDLATFSEKYMRSNFTERQMDTKYSRYQLREPEECLDFIFPEIGDIPAAGQPVSHAAAFWTGFIYRGLYLATGISSRKLAEIIPFSDMAAMYGYHLMDELMQLEKIIENYHLHPNDSDKG